MVPIRNIRVQEWEARTVSEENLAPILDVVAEAQARRYLSRYLGVSWLILICSGPLTALGCLAGIGRIWSLGPIPDAGCGKP